MTPSSAGSATATASRADQGRHRLRKRCAGRRGVGAGVPGRPGDAVLLHSPTYIGFTHTLEDNGYRIVHSPLVQDENGTWRMDYADMDRKCKETHPCGDFLLAPQPLRPRVGAVGN